jgi:hypothetical protein
LPATDPTPEELQRELEAVRAAAPPLPEPPRSKATKFVAATVILWILVILGFLAAWQVMNPSQPRPTGTAVDVGADDDGDLSDDD